MNKAHSCSGHDLETGINPHEIKIESHCLAQFYKNIVCAQIVLGTTTACISILYNYFQFFKEPKQNNLLLFKGNQE